MAYCELFFQLGLEPRENSINDWQRDLGDYLIGLEDTTDDGEGAEWWLTVACNNEEPRYEFAGNLGACILQYAAVVTAIQSGVFGGRR